MGRDTQGREYQEVRTNLETGDHSHLTNLYSRFLISLRVVSAQLTLSVDFLKLRWCINSIFVSLQLLDKNLN